MWVGYLPASSRREEKVEESKAWQTPVPQTHRSRGEMTSLSNHTVQYRSEFSVKNRDVSFKSVAGDYSNAPANNTF